MRIWRFISLWLLLACLVFSLSFPIKKAGAQSPFAFSSLTYQETNGSIVTVPNGGKVYRGVTQLVATFNHPLNPNLHSGLTLKDSMGATVNLQTIDVGGTNSTSLVATLQPPLQKSSTYTFTISGGANGVTDAQNNTLPADITVTFVTDDASVLTTMNLQGYQQGTTPNMVMYRFTAEQGPFTFTTNRMKVGNSMILVLEDPTAQKAVYNSLLIQKTASDTPTAQFSLPNSGPYDLILIPKYAPNQTVHADSYTVTSNELQIPDTYFPPVTLNSMQPYQTVSTPFKVGAGILNNGPTKYLRLDMNGTVLSVNLLQNGTVQDYTIDPTKLPDNVYTLGLSGESPNSPNMGIALRMFYVDHQNTYTDVPVSHYAHKAIEVMSHIGILHGIGGSSFAPYHNVTREDFAVMMAGVLQMNTANVTPKINFVDEQNDYAKGAIDALAAHGLISGEVINGQTYFHPKASITRQDACTMIGNALGISKSDISAQTSQFPDFGQVSTYAQPSVMFLSKQKWVSGFGSPVQFHPTSLLDRGQAAEILSKFLGLM